MLCRCGSQSCQQHIATSASCFPAASGMQSWPLPAPECSHRASRAAESAAPSLHEHFIPSHPKAVQPLWTQRSGFACTQSLNAPPSKQVSAFYGRQSTPALQGQLQPGLWAMSACMPLSHRAAACPSPASTSCILSLIFHSPFPLQFVTKMQIVRNGCFMGGDDARAHHSPPVSCTV